jgi:hypothetical protein
MRHLRHFANDIRYDGKQLTMSGSKHALLAEAPEKKWAPKGRPFLARLGSPTWARTRDLRINSRFCWYFPGISLDFMGRHKTHTNQYVT